ncbi:tetratricopeptide repeat protein [Halomicronema sp. CCY15110]|uniref:tetratricopeptide repeat protein n=1 Tax=Halomicronema sp. CCY15110 TaxID=2767773 RepID=UPI00194EDF66|nr:tetratricopeptide repeat protein [Halomicronema sp. CCY15110]
MTISLCMIVKDEAANLPRCLESVKDCVDEMLIWDTGSQDGTIAIAQSFGATVNTTEWANDFAAARNQSIAPATSDWILVLDADETLTEAGRELLQQLRTGESLADRPVDSIVAINLMRYEVNADQSPYSEVSRLFRNHVGLTFERPYHETIDDSVLRLMQAAPDWQVVLWPQAAIAHTGYGADAIAQRDKFTRAAQIMSAYLAEHPQDAYICNKLGALFVSVGHTERGRLLLERGLAAQPTDASTLYELHYHLGLAYRDARLTAIAIDHYQKALAQDVPAMLKVGALINLGSLYQTAKNDKGAIAVYEQAIAATPDFALPYFNLGIARRSLGDLPGAVAAYEQAIARDPNYAAAHQNLAVALFKLSKLPESIEAFQRAIALYRQSDPAQADRLLDKISALGIKM